MAEYHQRLRKPAAILNERNGMHVVFIAHAETETIEPPDQDQFTRYSLRLGKKSIAHYVDDVDVVGFLRLETFTTGDGERKKALSDGTRELICHAVASNVSKNRFGITEPLIVRLGENPLVKFIPFLNTTGSNK